MGHGASKEEIQQLFVEIDRDGSGAIEWREFLQVLFTLWIPCLRTVDDEDALSSQEGWTS